MYLSPSVHTSRGEVLGYRNREGILTFRGVPYAAAPVDDLRFRAPVEHQGWTGPRDATVYGPTPPQTPTTFRGPKYNYRAIYSPAWVPGDDYLNLNVWTPDTSAKLPVFVWIHGGGFVEGNGSASMYDGTRFARDGIVAVSINYRLGTEGWLKLPDGDANVGFQDQVAALRWVHENIAAFGGDPERVTIAGESAGAMSVSLHLTSSASLPHFRNAICQSGVIGDRLAPVAAAEANAVRLAKHLGIPNTREAYLDFDAITLLRELSSVHGGAHISTGGMTIFPYGDGEVLASRPATVFRAGSAASKRVIVGYNSDEANQFTVPTGVEDRISQDDLDKTVSSLGVVGKPLLQIVTSANPSASAGQLVSALTTQSMFAGPTLEFVDAQNAAGGDVWLYEFARVSPQFDGRMGAAHIAELPFVFDILDHEHAPALLGEDRPQQLADAMHGAWVKFIVGDDPGWTSYVPDSRISMRFDVDSREVAGAHDGLLAAFRATV